MRARCALALVFAARLFSQAGGSVPKSTPVEYTAHGVAGAVGIGAEYLVHSIPAGNQTLFAQDYLVVEVAVFPGHGTPAELGSLTFGLRINGRKQLIYPDAPGFVESSLKYPDWEPHPNAQARIGVGPNDDGVILGAPPTVARFPGDPSVVVNRLPSPPKAPDPETQNGVEREENMSPEEVLARYSLPEGAIGKPVSGYIYFHYRAKTKSIKSLELVFDSKQGTATLKLM